MVAEDAVLELQKAPPPRRRRRYCRLEDEEQEPLALALGKCNGVDWRGVSRSRSRAPMRLDTIDDEGNMDGAALFSRSAPNANAFDGFNFADLAQFDGTDAFGAFDSALDTDDFSDLLRPTAPTLPDARLRGLPPAAVHAEPRAPHARCRCRMPSAARLTRTSSGPIGRMVGRRSRIFSSR